MESHFPIIAIELVLVLGGAIAFYIWQMRDLRNEREKRDRREAENATQANESEVNEP